MVGCFSKFLDQAGNPIFNVVSRHTLTGFGLIRSHRHQLQCVSYGALKPPPSASLPERLHHMWGGLRDLLAEHRPEVVVVEEVFHAVNARSALVLGHARGAALVAAAESGCLIVSYTPAEIKKAVVGYGRAEKGQIQAMVKLLLRLDKLPTPADAADALAVAICHSSSAALKLKTLAPVLPRRRSSLSGGKA